MIYHIVLYKLDKSVNEDLLDKIIRRTRMQFLRIPEAMSLKCGKTAKKDSEWPFFIAVEVESMRKLKIFYDDPIYIKFNEEIIKPYTTYKVSLSYELDPTKIKEKEE